MQKDAGGNWQVTGLVARIAPEEGVVTSPRSGGLVAPAERVLAHSFGRRGREVLEELTDASVRVARCIDAHLGPCGELGLDLGVTRAGAVQLIEVNGKPLRVSLMRWGNPGAAVGILRYPICYAAALDLAV